MNTAHLLKPLEELSDNLRAKTSETKAALARVTAGLIGVAISREDLEILQSQAQDILAEKRYTRYVNDTRVAFGPAWAALAKRETEKEAAAYRAKAKAAAAKRAAERAGTPVPEGAAPPPADNVVDMTTEDDLTLTDFTEQTSTIFAKKSKDRIYHQGAALVRLRTDSEKPFIELLTEDALKGELDRVVTFLAFVGVGKLATVKRVDPPQKIVKNLRGWSDYSRFRRMEGLTTTPFVSPSGRIVNALGYDEETGTYLAETLNFDRVPDVPTAEDVKAALALLGEPFYDFPFDPQHGQAGLANSLAALIGPVARPIYRGPTPLILIDASAERSGKGLLAEVINLILTGRTLNVQVFPREDDEMRKKILAVLSQGPTLVLLDNINRLVDSSALAALATAEVIEDRILGKTEMRSVPNRAEWVLTGNNVQLTRENLFRCAWIRLVPAVENPGFRTGPTEGSTWRHENLPGWVLEHRSQLFRAVLVLIQNWLAQGRPLFKERTLGRFEGWCEVIGGILQAAGVEGFLENLPELKVEAEWERGGWPDFLDEWYGLWGEAVMTVEDQVLLDLASAAGIIPDLPDGAEKRKELAYALRSKSGMFHTVGGLGVSVTLTRFDAKSHRGAHPRPGVKRGWRLIANRPSGGSDGNGEQTRTETGRWAHRTDKTPPLVAPIHTLPQADGHMFSCHVTEENTSLSRGYVSGLQVAGSDVSDVPMCPTEGISERVSVRSGPGQPRKWASAAERMRAKRAGRTPGRPKKWASEADRLRAYRDRQADGGVPETNGGPPKPSATWWSTDTPPGTITDPEEIARLFSDPTDHAAVDRALTADAAYRLARRRKRRPR